MNIAILGAGGHAKVVASIIRQINLRHEYGFYTSNDSVPAEAIIFIGVGNKPAIGRSGLSVRQELFRVFKDRIPFLVAPSAIIRAPWAPGIQALERVVVNAGSNLGDNVLLNTGCIVEHDCHIKAHSHIAPGAILCGGVTVGERTHVGAGSVVKQGVSIGSDCVVQMGAVVVKDLPNGHTILANGKIIPAR